MAKCKLRIIISSILVVVGVCGVRVPVQAQETSQPFESVNCGVSVPQYEALYQMEADSYDMYVRMGKPGQLAGVRLYFQPFASGGACQSIGAASVTANGWAKVGVLEAKATLLGTLVLASADFQDVPNANRPTVMLVSRTHPACQPTTECYVTLGDKQGVVHASGTQLNEDSLHVVTAKDPASDKLERADYYIDNKFAYSRTTIEPFDLRYVSSDKHTLAIVATYQSKQQVVISEEVRQGYSDEIGHLLFTFYNRNRVLLVVVGTLVASIVLFVSGLAVARGIYQRRTWKARHFLKPSKAPKSSGSPAPWQPHFLKQGSIKELARPLALITAGFCGLIALMIVANAWAFQIYSVDGESMQSTLNSGNKLLVNKVSKTYASVTNKDFVPGRGSVIVFSKEKNVAFEPVDTQPAEFLVKRVIGLPGERVTVKGSVVTVFNADNPSGFTPDVGRPWSGSLILTSDDQIDITLGPDEVFVCGDNRPGSIDSRAFGPVKLRDIVGTVPLSLSPAKKL